MKKILVLLASAMMVLTSCSETQKKEPVKVIFETDMCFDVDDVAALAVLHEFQNQGKAEILAVSFNEVHPDGVAAIDAINTYYNRPDLPVGLYKEDLFRADFSKYLTRVAAYPNDTPKDFNELRDAQDVYVEALTQAPDHSVKIISVGFMNNLADLVENHRDLVAQKVSELIIMGGIGGDDFNLVRHNTAHDAETVFENWPTKIVMTGLGSDVISGRCLEKAKDSPVREAFKAFFDDQDLRIWGRCSWDSIAALYAVEGTDLFEERWDATVRLKCGKKFPMSQDKITYIEYLLEPAEYEEIIDNMLLQK